VIIHECDRCKIKISGWVTFVRLERELGPYANAADPDNKPFEFELCNECVLELKRFQDGCSIQESYRQGPRGSPRAMVQP
jgi:hypothetical protein